MPRSMAGRLLGAILAALILWLAAPGIRQATFLVWVGLVPLFFALRGASSREALITGFTFGLLFNLLLIYWVVVAMHRFGGMPVPAAILALFFLASYLALFPAIFSLLISRPRNGAILLFLAPAAWVGLDSLRAILFTGFPWMDLAYDLYRQPFLIQVSELFGHHLVTFIIVLSNFLLYGVISARISDRPSPIMPRHRLIATLAISGFLILNLFSYRTAARVAAAAPRKKIAIVQGNIPQDQKWRPEFQRKTISAYLRMSLAAVKEGPELIVWPETAMPFYPRESPLWQLVSEALLKPSGIPLVSGAPHREKKGAIHRYYNSAFVADGRGIRGRYDKEHLVPFGEYVPLRKLLFFLSPVVDSIGDFASGTNGAPLSCGPNRLGLLICFETIFPELAARRVSQGSDLLIDLTNDAWYGRTSAPWQDLAMAVFRAVETRRSMARAANTGFSAFIDPLGRLHEVSPLFVPWWRVASLPIMKTRTVMVFYGGRFFGIFCLLATVICLAAEWRRKRQT